MSVKTAYRPGGAPVAWMLSTICSASTSPLSSAAYTMEVRRWPYIEDPVLIQPVSLSSCQDMRAFSYYCRCSKTRSKERASIVTMYVVAEGAEHVDGTCIPPLYFSIISRIIFSSTLFQLILNFWIMHIRVVLVGKGSSIGTVDWPFLRRGSHWSRKP